MIIYVIYSMIYVGSALMLFNVCGYFRFAFKNSSREGSWKNNVVLYIPFALVVLFLFGYLGVAIWGNPDLLVAAILFGGSIFVFVVYLLLHSITKKIKMKEEVEAKLRAAEESRQAKTAFLSEVSHEMRTPLNIILGVDTLAFKDPSLSQENLGRFEKIDSSAKYLLGLVNNILDMNSIDSGELSLKNEEFSLDGILGQVDAIVDSIAKEKGVRFSSMLEDSAKGYYLGDESRIKQILFALLDNAVKYTEKGGEVSLRVSREESLQFVVSDTGVGMDPSFLDKIFTPFSREDGGIRATRGGTGLGLAVTKGIVDKIGGSIEVKTEKGVGSTFLVKLPLAVSKKEEGASLSGKRILIAEDIPENAEIVADLLELEEMESERAENGKVALEMFQASAPHYYDAILMDLRMPVMDGLTATKEIRWLDREDAKTVPIIALTANAFESDIRQSLDAGMDAHLSKPADSEKLYDTLRRVLRK